MRIIFLLLMLPASQLLAHPGHDHETGNEYRPLSQPFFVAEANGLELLGRLHQGTLTLWLDEWASNTPITGAQLELQSGNWQGRARETTTGSYIIRDEFLQQPGRHALMIFVQTSDLDEVLIATLEIPFPETVGKTTDQSASSLQIPAPLLPLLLLVPIAVLLLMHRYRSRHLASPVVLLLLAGVLHTPGHAHDEDSHDTVRPSAIHTDDRPARLPDGSLFLPKKTQHLLDIRTTQSTIATLQKTITLNGHIIPDANAGSLVQAPHQGRISAPETGLPLLGSEIRKGQTLAYLLPLAAAVDEGERAAQLAEVKGALDAAEQQLQRLQGMRENIAQKELDDARVAVRSLQRQREVLEKSLYRQEPVIASSSGILSTRNVQTGQVVAAGETLFEIIQPQKLWVEVLAHEASLATRIHQASLSLASGETLTASFLGSGRHLRNQAIPLQFALQPPLPTLAIGEQVTLVVQLNESLQGVAIPREALVRGADGLPRLWLKQAAEQYVPQHVVAVPLDGRHLAVTRGLQGDERIVVQGASLLEQVR